MVRLAALSCAALLALASPVFAQAVNIVGTYTVTGTETNGKPYDSAGKVVVKQEKSGAYEVSWDDGQYIGLGQVIGDVFAIGAVADKRISISIMNIKPDGNMSGSWWRRTDKGAGTEVWTKKP